MTRLNTRKNRRLYVTLYALALVFLYPFLHEYLGLLPTLAFLFVSPLYYARSALIAVYRKDRMDERERGVALASYESAYAILALTLVVSLFVDNNYPPSGWLAGAARYFLFTPSVLFDPFTMTLLVLVLPACVIAWLEPDPPAEETFSHISKEAA